MAYRCLAPNFSRAKAFAAARTAAGGVGAGIESVTLCTSLTPAAATLSPRGCRYWPRVIQMPAPKELLLALPEHVLPIVRFEVEFPVLADVGKVCRDGADPPSPAGHLDHDFRRPAHDRALDLLDLCCREATRLRRTRPSAAKQVQEGAISRRHAKGTPTQSGSPRP